jgi:hypothetical protein
LAGLSSSNAPTHCIDIQQVGFTYGRVLSCHSHVCTCFAAYGRPVIAFSRVCLTLARRPTSCINWVALLLPLRLCKVRFGACLAACVCLVNGPSNVVPQLGQLMTTFVQRLAPRMGAPHRSASNHQNALQHNIMQPRNVGVLLRGRSIQNHAHALPACTRRAAGSGDCGRHHSALGCALRDKGLKPVACAVVWPGWDVRSCVRRTRACHMSGPKI